MKSRSILTLALAGLGAFGVYHLLKPEENLVTGKSGHHWRVVLLGNTGGTKSYELFAPAGEWGPAPELSVLRYSQTGSDMGSRKILGVGAGVPEAMKAAAASDFGLSYGVSTLTPGTSG
jgi:hypothetical protein